MATPSLTTNPAPLHELTQDQIMILYIALDRYVEDQRYQLGEQDCWGANEFRDHDQQAIKATEELRELIAPARAVHIQITD